MKIHLSLTKFLSVVLIFAIAYLAFDIYYGRNGIAQYNKVSSDLKELTVKTQIQKKHNIAIEDEIKDLKQGDVAIEDLARSELGLIYPNETFYRVIKDSNK